MCFSGHCHITSSHRIEQIEASPLGCASDIQNQSGISWRVDCSQIIQASRACSLFARAAKASPFGPLDAMWPSERRLCPLPSTLCCASDFWDKPGDINEIPSVFFLTCHGFRIFLWRVCRVADTFACSCLFAGRQFPKTCLPYPLNMLA